MKSFVLALIACGPVFLFTSGCAQVMQPISKLQHETMRAFKPKPFDSDWSGEDEIDQWGYVGEEARGDRPRERDPDQWYKKYVMSSKARSIERNLGID
ncbi:MULTISPECIES: hypothetical protein [Gimesia]|uniref:hypothetical protein n=1 Tax=Gimesia TaxID=1649453 RepID=UPI00118BCCCD|nr:hypothetical protein [Gimesia chilikensis]QDT85927.1 hypothetical protein MalM14_35990 [Gimesia chilikensis]